MINFLGATFQFNSIDQQAIITSPCPDQVVGELNDGKFKVYKNRIDINYVIKGGVNNQLISPIVVILESPHKDEYDPITLQALGPAMGVTGVNFKTYFDTLLNGKWKNVLKKGQHSIVLFNAVQFQCSLGNKLSGMASYKNKKKRDENFLLCLDDVNNNDMIKRLKAIRPTLVINLCTVGLKKNNLCEHVSSLLRQGTINYTNGTHPSRWNNPMHRKIN